MITLKNMTEETIIARCDNMEDVYIEAGETADFTQEQTDYLKTVHKADLEIVCEKSEGPKIKKKEKKEKEIKKEDEPVQSKSVQRREEIQKESVVKKIVKKVVEKKK